MPQTKAQSIPIEADLDRAPGLLEGARTLELSPRQCSLAYWLDAVAQGTLSGLTNGHRPEITVPDWMRSPGPLRSALIAEFGFRSIAEEKATRALAYLVRDAPDIAGMEFFGTQLIDEARHSSVFRGHLLELGIPEPELMSTIDDVAGAESDAVLVPLEEFGIPIGRDHGDYIGGVVVLTVLVEGVLAPAAELSERKWRLLNPAAAQIERAAGIDEIRHLSVGSSIVRDHLRRYPGDRARLLGLIDQGQSVWADLPVFDVILRREAMFQEGMMAMADLIGDYELRPGRRLIDTTPEERLLTAATWSADMQSERLLYMGLA